MEATNEGRYSSRENLLGVDSTPFANPVILLPFTGSFSIYFPTFLSRLLFFLFLFDRIVLCPFPAILQGKVEGSVLFDTIQIETHGPHDKDSHRCGGGWLMDFLLRPMYDRREKIREKRDEPVMLDRVGWNCNAIPRKYDRLIGVVERPDRSACRCAVFNRFLMAVSGLASPIARLCPGLPRFLHPPFYRFIIGLQRQVTARWCISYSLSTS